MCHCSDYHNKASNYSTSLLEIQEVYTNIEISEFTNSFVDENSTLLSDKLRFDKKNDGRFYELPHIFFAKKEDTALINKMFTDHLNENWIESTGVRFIWSKKDLKFKDSDTLYHVLYAIKTKNKNPNKITHKEVESARKTIDPHNGDIGVSIAFNEKGAEKFQKLTSKCVGGFIAISSYNKVLSAPNIMAPITGGEIFIDGDFTEKEAETLIDWINCDTYAARIGMDKFEKEIEKCE